MKKSIGRLISSVAILCVVYSLVGVLQVISITFDLIAARQAIACAELSTSNAEGLFLSGQLEKSDESKKMSDNYLKKAKDFIESAQWTEKYCVFNIFS